VQQLSVGLLLLLLVLVLVLVLLLLEELLPAAGLLQQQLCCLQVQTLWQTVNSWCMVRLCADDETANQCCMLGQPPRKAAQTQQWRIRCALRTISTAVLHATHCCTASLQALQVQAAAHSRRGSALTAE
jgi:hypothetical protein